MSLDLSDNPLTGEVSEALAHALRGQDGLRVLNLNDTSLGDEGIRSVAEVSVFACRFAVYSGSRESHKAVGPCASRSAQAYPC